MGPGDRSEGYSGSDSYLYVEKLIHGRGRSLSIICPFISPSYARVLVKESARKEVRVITSNSKITSEAVSIMRKGRGYGAYLKFLAYVTALCVILFIIGLYIFALALVPFVAMAIALAAVFRAASKSRRIKVKVGNERFIHEKIYLADDYAIVGSANLTYSGLHKNVEHIEVIHDGEKLSQMGRHFEELWGDIAT